MSREQAGRFKPYPAYKDSGVEWLGEIPTHWASGPLKCAFDIQLGKMLQNEQAGALDVEVPYFKAAHVQWHAVSSDCLPTMWASPSDLVTYGVDAGDLLVCEGGEGGRCGIVEQVPEKAIIQNALHRVRPMKAASLRFLEYALNTASTQGWFDVLNNKATIAHFTRDKMAALRIPLPHEPDQRAIAAFLDRETARIDALVAKKERLIELLQEKRTALITRAVTKGLDPSVPMKDSGVEWLGEIPAHWGVKPIRALARSGYKAFTDGDWIESPYIRDEGIRLIQTGNIGVGEYREQGFRYIDEETFRAFNCTEVLPGDLLICRLADPVGRACLAPDLGDRMITSVDVCILKPARDVNAMYVVYALSGVAYLAWLGGICRGGTRDRVSRSMLGAIRVQKPPLDEQATIVAYLDDTTAKLDALIAKIRDAIAGLKELRMALISAAVTGKIDVRQEVA